MAWDFETEPEFQEKLDWADAFVRDEVEPLDLVFPGLAYHPLDDARRPIVDPLKQRVREQDLWAAHLGPELGGKGWTENCGSKGGHGRGGCWCCGDGSQPSRWS